MIEGRTYDEQDFLAFAEIEQAITECRLDRAQAQMLGASLQAWLQTGESAAEILERMRLRLPMLGRPRWALFAYPSRSVDILATLFAARSRAKAFQSGELPAVALEPVSWRRSGF